MYLVEIEVFLFFVLVPVYPQNMLDLQIIIPEIVCGKDVNKFSKTAIQFAGKDLLLVDFEFRVDFKKNEEFCDDNTQRCNLFIWKSVRNFERFLKNYPKDRIYDHGLIEINNTMLYPGTQYILHIGILKDGEVVEEKQIIFNVLESVDGLNPVDASVRLLGPSDVYARSINVFNADLILCSELESYHISWELTDETETIKTFQEKGLQLIIPPKTFRVFHTYLLRVTLLNKDSAAISQATKLIRVSPAGVLLNLPFTETTVKLYKTITINPYIEDLDNSDQEYNIEWTCLHLDTNQTSFYENTFHNKVGIKCLKFNKTGKYRVTLRIARLDVNITSSCKINVFDEIPSIGIEKLQLPVPAKRDLQINSILYDLKTLCTLQWINYTDLNMKNLTELTTIIVRNDLFLEELEEYSNDTIDKTHYLFIPGEYLIKNSKYLFRLFVKCPNVTTIYSEIEVVTGGLNLPRKFDVFPRTGEAFNHLFRFIVETVKNKSKIGTFLCNLGIVLNIELTLWSITDDSKVELILPYSNDEIRTFMTCCDGSDSCDQIEGPMVKTTVPHMDYNSLFDVFGKHMMLEEYYKAFTQALFILHSYRSMNDTDLYFKSLERIQQRTYQELNHFLNQINTDEQWEYSTQKLLHNLEEFKNYLNLTQPTATIQELQNKINNIYGSGEGINLRQLLSVTFTNYTAGEYQYYEMVEVNPYLIITVSLVGLLFIIIIVKIILRNVDDPCDYDVIHFSKYTLLEDADDDNVHI